MAHPNEVSLQEAYELRDKLSKKDRLYEKKEYALTVQIERLKRESENEKGE